MRLVSPRRPRSVSAALAWAATRDVSFMDDTVANMSYRRVEYASAVGRGAADFDRARTGLKNWAAHRTAGVRVFPPGTAVSTGATCVVTFGTPLVAIAAPCRITAVVDRRTSWGFTYRTLAGHPEQGEESFEVELGDDDVVRFSVTARSRPGSRLVALGGPLNHLVQRKVTEGYLRALVRHVRHS